MTVPASRPNRSRPVSPTVISLYFLVLLMVGNLGAPGPASLASIPINYLFKDQWKLGPERVALYGFLVGIPFYLGFFLGTLRDRWQPLGGQDRGYMRLMPPAIAAGLIWLAFQPLTYDRILLTILLSGFCGVLLLNAIQGLMTVTAQRHSLSGRLSAVFSATGFLPGVVGTYAGGWLTAHVKPQMVLQLTAVVILLVMALSYGKPHGVYLPAPERIAVPEAEPLPRMYARLLRHRPLLLPAFLLFLWGFAPGWNTPLFFYLTNTVKLTSEQYGSTLSIQAFSTLAFVLLYGLICRKVRLGKLLWIGLLVAVAGSPLYWFIHTPWQAYGVAALAGASCGILNTAMLDLLLRSCPRGTEGVALGLSGGAGLLAWNSADIFGAWLYSRGGFGLALVVTLLTTAAMAIPIRAIPRPLMEAREGESEP